VFFFYFSVSHGANCFPCIHCQKQIVRAPKSNNEAIED
jgi:hypothetical protein